MNGFVGLRRRCFVTIGESANQRATFGGCDQWDRFWLWCDWSCRRGPGERDRRIGAFSATDVAIDWNEKLAKGEWTSVVKPFMLFVVLQVDVDWKFCSFFPRECWPRIFSEEEYGTLTMKFSVNHINWLFWKCYEFFITFDKDFYQSCL